MPQSPIELIGTISSAVLNVAEDGPVLGHLSNTRAFIEISLAGILALSIVLIVPFLLGCVILRTMPVLRVLIETILFLLAAVPLVAAAMAAIGIPFLFEALGISEATRGNLEWCLGIALAMTILSGILFIFSRKAYDLHSNHS